MSRLGLLVLCALLALLAPAPGFAQRTLTQYEINVINDEIARLEKLSPFERIDPAPTEADVPMLPKLPKRFCSEPERTAYDKTIMQPAMAQVRDIFRRVGNYRSQLDTRVVENRQEQQRGKDRWGAAPYPEPLLTLMTMLQDRVDVIEREQRRIQPIYEKIAPQVDADVTYANATLQAVPVEPCTAPTLAELSLPEIPKSFCSADDRDKALRLLEVALAEAGTQIDSILAWARDVAVRRTFGGDAKDTAALEAEENRARDVAAAKQKLAGELTAALEAAQLAHVSQCVDPCLVGRWVGVTPKFAGFTITISPDGTQLVDYSDSKKQVLAEGEEISWSGVGVNTLAARDGVATVTGNGDSNVILTVVTKAQPEPMHMPWPTVGFAGLGITAGNNGYQCSAQTLTYDGSTLVSREPNIAITLRRLK